MTKEAPEHLFVQIYGEAPMKTLSASTTDPREVHDNGKPVYEYALVRPVSAGPCSPCGDGDTAMELHSHDSRPGSAAVGETQKIVPCPLCDCKVFKDGFEKFSATTRGILGFSYRCPKCRSQFAVFGKSEADAMLRWNTRTQPIQPAEQAIEGDER